MVDEINSVLERCRSVVVVGEVVGVQHVLELEAVVFAVEEKKWDLHEGHNVLRHEAQTRV